MPFQDDGLGAFLSAEADRQTLAVMAADYAKAVLEAIIAAQETVGNAIRLSATLEGLVLQFVEQVAALTPAQLPLASGMVTVDED